MQSSNQSAPTNESVLAEAERIINGPRRDAYGPAEESFARIAKVWSGIIQAKLKCDITSREVALLMIGLKTCRDANKSGRDNLADIAGYAGLAEKL